MKGGNLRYRFRWWRFLLLYKLGFTRKEMKS